MDCIRKLNILRLDNNDSPETLVKVHEVNKRVVNIQTIRARTQLIYLDQTLWH